MHITKLVILLLASWLLTACGDKSAEQKANPEAEKTNAPATASQITDRNAPPGKALHDANCISCHDAKVYTRVERKVLDYTQLAAQVKRCDANLGSRLFDEDLAQITDYLNQAYYKYPKP
ncbi:cytochrome c [uncultured Thiothrix sp.]|uniref:c-type cytochrome n=1 Tax=uncultured Thiothrix sp. TaxID=223185 RepID=UPI0026136C39|nr:cytochrome c [uncultured Thiothrix sp.]